MLFRLATFAENEKKSIAKCILYREIQTLFNLLHSSNEKGISSKIELIEDDSSEKMEIDNHSEPLKSGSEKLLFKTITEFCNIPANEKVDGLIKMKALINRQEVVTITQLIELAKWKKSDYDSTRFFHKEIRGRAPEVEQFYQNLAALDPNNQEAIEGFINQYNQMGSPKSTSNNVI